MRDTSALAAVHALVQAAGGPEELRGTAALLGAICGLQAGSTVSAEAFTVAWRRTGRVKRWPEVANVRQP